MTYREKYNQTTDWRRRIIIISLFHQIQLNTHSKWQLWRTAKYFNVSIGHVSEEVFIGKHLASVKSIGTRKDAFIELKKKFKRR